MNQANKGQSLIETVFVIPIIFIFLFFTIEFSMLTIGKRLVQYASFRLARTLLTILPDTINTNEESTDEAVKQKITTSAQKEAYEILKKIPFRKKAPLISWENEDQEVSVDISQEISFLGKPYEIKNKLSLYR